MLVCTAEQMRELDRATIEEIGVAGVVLMEAAGRGVVDVVCEAVDVAGLRVVVLSGCGNNGGDGFVAARHLVSRGAEVSVWLAGTRDQVSGDALVNLVCLDRLGLGVSEVPEAEVGAVLHAELQSAHVVVDALLGTGLREEVRGRYRGLVDAMNRASGLKVAVDVSTGLHADTGEALGAAVRADHTVTFGYPKVGLVSHPGCDYAGQLHVIDIGIPRSFERSKAFAARLIEPDDVRGRVVPRVSGGHKGTFGHLLVMAGSPGKTGAALLCGDAAMRSGVGLCTIAAPAEVLAAMESKTRETMLAALVPAGQGLDDSDELFEGLGELAANRTAMALGPGIPAGPGTTDFVVRLLEEARVPLLIDADGLNALTDDVEAIARAQVPVVLTPHPGEMARLVARGVREVQRNRLGAARDLALRTGAYVALKGSRTVIATPDGKTFINPTGNSGMGSGGTGDALTGLVAGLLAQGYEPEDALVVGVYLHGAAGDRVAERVGEHALIASDLIAEVGAVFRPLERSSVGMSVD